MIANLTITGTISGANNPIQDKPHFVAFDLFILEYNYSIKVSYWGKKETPIDPNKLNGLSVLCQGEVYDHGQGVSLKADTMVIAKGSANNIMVISAISRPEYHFTQSGRALFSFSMRSKLWDGIKKENLTSWFKVSAWNKDADTLVQYIKDKHYLIVNGEFRVKKWKTNEGAEKTNMEVTVKSFTFLPKSMQPGGESNEFTNQIIDDNLSSHSPSRPNILEDQNTQIPF